MADARHSIVAFLLATSFARADVVTSISGTQLTITGDDTPDVVDVASAPAGVMVIGRNGTLVDGSANGVTVPGVRRLVAKLGKGSDYLTVTNLELPDGVNLRLGRGHDTVVLDDVGGGAARIRTGDGDDAVAVIDGSNLKHLTIETSTGWDSVLVESSWIRSDLHVDTGSDPDAVTVANTTVYDDINVRLGNDDDYVELVDVAVADDVTLDGGNGDDFVVFAGYIWIGDDLDLDGFGDDF